MTTSIEIVESALSAEKGTTSNEIRTITGLKSRTIRYALRKLHESGKLVKKSYLRDMRTIKYFLKPNKN